MTELEELLEARLVDVRQSYLIDLKQDDAAMVLYTFGDWAIVATPVPSTDDAVQLELRVFFKHASVDLQIITIGV